MAYDNYGRPSRVNGEPSYFETHDPTPKYGDPYYSSGPPPQGIDPLLRSREFENTRNRRSLSTGDTKLPSDSGYSDHFNGAGDVSRETIEALTAKISERVTKEVVDRLKQSGALNDWPQAPPLERKISNRSNSSFSEGQNQRKVYTPTSPIRPTRNMYTASHLEEPARSPPLSPLEQPSGARYSDRRPTVDRTFSTLELSAVDEKWGKLFDEKKEDATPRGEQFLRGIANHMIEVFDPSCSIVMTPPKMAKFYEMFALEEEKQPLLTLFRAQSAQSISYLYKDLEAEYFLVQETPTSVPTIPALTPRGFAWWMTVHIFANPDDEWQRLQKVVESLPINADGQLVDGKPERLPKQISRHLLPGTPNPWSVLLIDKAMTNFLRDLGSAPRHHAPIASPPVSRHPSVAGRTRPVEIHQERSPTSPSIQPIPERDRNPYGGPASETSGNGDNAPKIERERQPYTAQQGGGKIFTENVNSKSSNRMSRANSSASRRSEREPVDRSANPQAYHQRTHSNSIAGQGYIPTGSRRGRRTSSPPMKSFRNTEPLDINLTSRQAAPAPATSAFEPGSYGSAGSAGLPPLESRENRRTWDERQFRRKMDEDLRYTGENHNARDIDRHQESVDADRKAFNNEFHEPPPRGAPIEDWYRTDGRGADYDSYRRH